METLNLIGWGFFVVLRFGGLYYLNPGGVMAATVADEVVVEKKIN